MVAQQKHCCAVLGTSTSLSPAKRETRVRQISSQSSPELLRLEIIALAFLPIYYTNLTSRADGTMHVYPVPDVLFHIAVANELTHTIPPQAPHFSGHPLAYHYAMDLVVAMFAKATGLSTVDLTVRFVPTLLLVLSMLSVFCFSRSWLGSGYFGALVVFLVFLWRRFVLYSRLAAAAKTLIGPFAISVCRPQSSPCFIPIQFFLEWVSCLPVCFVCDAT